MTLPPDKTQEWDPDDLPETYYILGTLHGFKFVVDIMEGERMGALLDTILARLPSGVDPVDRGLMFLKFKDYTGAVTRVQIDFIDSFYLSTVQSRAFDEALITDRRKRGYGTGDDD